MGGEYLPNLMPNEVEIARVTMTSTTMDVISIRARHTKHKIIYRIVDEYMEPDDDRYSGLKGILPIKSIPAMCGACTSA
jgi:hypothetical protein